MGQNNTSWTVEGDSGPSNLGFSGSRKHVYRPQSYLDAREKFKDDPQMLARLDALEAQYGSFDYRDTIWDALGGQLGLWHPGSDVLRQQYAANFDSGLSDIINLAEDQAYNSPANMKRLNQAAGINSDLQGIGDVQPTSGIPQDETPPDLSGMFNSENMISNTVNTVGSAIAGAFSLFNGFEGLKSARLDNVIKELSAMGQGFGLGTDALPFLFNRGGMTDNGSEKTVLSIGDELSKQYNGLAGFLSPRAAKYLQTAGTYISRSFPASGAYADVKKNAASSILSAAPVLSELNGVAPGGLKGDVGKTLDAVSDSVDTYFKDAFALRMKLEKDRLSISDLQNAYNNDYWKNLNGVTAATAQNMQNQAITAREEYEKAENDFWNNLINTVNGDDFWSKALRFSMLIARASLRNGISLPSINSASSFNEGSGFSDWSKFGGHSENSRRGGMRNFGIRF